MNTIGKRIRNKRLALNYTLEKIAEDVGVTPSTVLKYEKGNINIPSDKIEKIAKSLKCSPAYLMGWIDSDTLPKEQVKTAARNKKVFDKFNKLDEAKRKIVEALIDSYFDENVEDEEN